MPVNGYKAAADFGGVAMTHILLLVAYVCLLPC
jgi:hypothetical protein